MTIDHDAPPAAELDPAFHESLVELEAYLEGMPPEQAAETVLPFASRWVLPQAGFELARLTEEARTLVQATPLSDRILAGYGEQVAWWVSQRMLLGENGEPDRETAKARVSVVRGELEQRAALVEAAGFVRIAAGFRQALEETAEGDPPAGLLWRALSLRIAESVLP